MKRVLIVAIAFLASVSLMGQSEGKFAFFADTHIAEGSSSIADLEACIKDVNMNPEIEFSILAGDITEFGSDREIKLAKSIIDKFEKPYYIVAGNHDAKWSESGCNTFEKVFGYGHFEFEAFGLKFVGTNSGPNMRMAPALVPRESIVLLDSLVKATPAEKPIVFVNHFPQDTSVLNYFQVLDILKKGNVQLVMGGHWHNNVKLDYEGIPGMLGRSSQARGKKGPGYNIVTVADGKISIAEKVVGMEPFEPWYELTLTEALPFDKRHDIYGERPDYSVNKKYSNVKELWTLQESGDIGAGAVYSGDNVVYTTTQGYVKCVSLTDGSSKWSVKLNGKVYSTPAIYKKYVVVGCTDNIIYCLDIKTGREIWKHHCDKSVLASANICDGIVYIGASDGRFRALNVKNGHLVWSYSDVKGFVESKAYVDDTQVVFGDWANTLYSLNPKTGKLMWTWKVKGSRMYSPAAVWPVKHENRLYIATPQRKTYAIEASSGSTMWEHRGGRESVGISALGDRIFVKTMKDTVFCFSTSPAMKAEVLWATDTDYGYDIAPTPTTYYEGVAFVPTDKGNIVALDAMTGEILWRYKLSFALINYIEPIKDRKLLVTTMDGKVSLLTY
ncbi:MAG: PQQ-binding-like beta-propeller repeat protein [Bacteroidales bacterium]|nr:PQQ-binding-like beta-propeller repeat protein [Bacteroidales bacterium]